MNELEIINLTKRFKLSKKQQKTNKTNDPYLTALKDFSLTLQEGEIFGILGPNGAGKTTALRIISSLIKPDEGLVKLNGEDIYKDVYSYRKRVGFLTSELKLDGFFTPDYTFTYMSRLYGIDEETIKANKEKIFNRFRERLCSRLRIAHHRSHFGGIRFLAARIQNYARFLFGLYQRRGDSDGDLFFGQSARANSRDGRRSGFKRIRALGKRLGQIQFYGKYVVFGLGRKTG